MWQTLKAGAGCAVLATMLSGPALAEVASEQLLPEKPQPPNSHRVYISDLSLAHIVDGKLHVVDGDTLRYVGLIPTAYAGQATLSADRREIYVATTYYPRLNRGERTDTVDIWDATTLEHRGEIVIPPKHAQALNYKGTIKPGSDGRLLFVQNATPASSVTVVDVQARKVLGEVSTPGCWIILPARSVGPRFSTLCGDGTILTVSLDAEGKVASQKRSKPFFDPDDDPLFVSAENDGDRYLFVSFKGRVHVADVGGEEARFDPPWQLPGTSAKPGGWRPGGYQVAALHAKTGRLFVTVHTKGREGSHKDPARQIWVYDTATKKRIGKAPGNNAIAIAVSDDDSPLLFALDGLKMGLVVYDAKGKLAYKRRLDPLAETATQLETH